MDIIRSHKYSSRNKEIIRLSTLCGCFFCLKIFPASEVKEWTDEGPQDRQITAICPYCDIDSVLGDSAVELSQELLTKMQHYWFY